MNTPLPDDILDRLRNIIRASDGYSDDTLVHLHVRVIREAAAEIARLRGQLIEQPAKGDSDASHQATTGRRDRPNLPEAPVSPLVRRVLGQAMEQAGVKLGHLDLVRMGREEQRKAKPRQDP